MNSCHLNISKVLKISNLLKYTNINLTRVIWEIFNYYQIWIENFAQVTQSIYQFLSKNISFIWKKEQIKVIDEINFLFTALFI